MSEPWTNKHRPKTISEVVGNKKAKDSIITWLESWQKGPPSKKAVLLHGPSGTGKTVTVEALANDLGYDIIEINASDRRNAPVLTRIVGSAATVGSLFGRGRLILLDEIDGINLREDSGAIVALIKAITVARFPILLTANNIWNPKIRSLRSHCLLIEFKRLGVRDSIPYLKKLCKLEGVVAEGEALRLIYNRNKGDMRSMINDLQIVLATRKQLTLENVDWLGHRDRQGSVFDALRIVFSSKDCLQARRAIDVTEVAYEMLYEWIYENVAYQLTDAADLENAIESLARADIYFARAKRFQAWRLLSFAFDMMTAGVAMSKLHTRPAWVPMKFPQRITRLSSSRSIRAMQQSIGVRIGSKIHISTSIAVKDVLPYLQIIFQNCSKMSSEITEYLGFDSDMIDFLKCEKYGTKKESPSTKRAIRGKKSRRRKVSSV